MEAVVKHTENHQASPGWRALMPTWTPLASDRSCGSRRNKCSLRRRKQVYPRVCPQAQNGELIERTYDCVTEHRRGCGIL